LGLGFSGGTSQVGVFFGLLYAAMDANPMSRFFRSSFFFKTRLSSESLEPLIGFLAYLEPKLCHKKWLKFLPLQKDKNFYPYKRTPGLNNTQLVYGHNSRQNRLKSCSSPLKTREDLWFRLQKMFSLRSQVFC